MKKSLDKLIAEKDTFDKASQDFISSLSFARNEIGEIGAMKQTLGWKILNKHIKEELHNRINELIKDDKNVQTLIALLSIADTKALSKQLDEAIDDLLPE